MSGEEKLKVEDVQDELTAEELAAAKSFGLIDSDDSDEETKSEDKEVEKEEISEEKEEEKEAVAKKEDSEKKEEIEEEVDHSSNLDETFEAMETNPQKEHEELSKFDKSQKAFYWKWKNTNKKKQEAVAKAELLELRLKAIEERVASPKRDAIDDILDTAEDNEPLTRKEFLQEKEEERNKANFAQQVKNRMFESGQKAQSLHNDFNEVAHLANELMNSDKTGQYYKLFFNEAEKHDGDPAEFIYKLGKTSPKYQPNMSKKPAPGNDAAQKLLNAKKQTSASLQTATESNVKKNVVGKIDYDTLTIEQAAAFSPAQWKDVPERAKKRLLQM